MCLPVGKMTVSFIDARWGEGHGQDTFEKCSQSSLNLKSEEAGTPERGVRSDLHWEQRHTKDSIKSPHRSGEQVSGSLLSI